MNKQVLSFESQVILPFFPFPKAVSNKYKEKDRLQKEAFHEPFFFLYMDVPLWTNSLSCIIYNVLLLYSFRSAFFLFYQIPRSLVAFIRAIALERACLEI